MTTSIVNCLFVGAGGALGAISRYLLGLIPMKAAGAFPMTTLIINVLGAFCIGLVVALAGRAGGLDPRLVLLLKAGFCGGFTTFSTYSLETVTLCQNGRWGLAALYVTLSVLLCLAAVLGGEAAGSKFLST